MSAILDEVAARHRLTVADLIGPDCTRKIVRPRHEAMWLMRQVRLADGAQRYSLPQIARRFGRDHSTVFQGVKAHQSRLATPAA